MVLLGTTAHATVNPSDADPVEVYEQAMNYLHGRNGFTEDAAMAVEYFRALADQNWSIAQNRMGEFYENGVGVTRDLDLAMTWYELAAEQGHPVAKAHAERLQSQLSLTAAR
jgi:TPR repeat protein